MNWLQTIADEDHVDLEAAAIHFVLSGATMSATEWANLEANGRAAVLVAQKLVRVQALTAAGRDMDAALEGASLDGGRQAARLMAHSVAQALAARPVT